MKFPQEGPWKLPECSTTMFNNYSPAANDLQLCGLFRKRVENNGDWIFRKRVENSGDWILILGALTVLCLRNVENWQRRVRLLIVAQIRNHWSQFQTGDHYRRNIRSK